MFQEILHEIESWFSFIEPPFLFVLLLLFMLLLIKSLFTLQRAKSYHKTLVRWYSRRLNRKVKTLNLIPPWLFDLPMVSKIYKTFHQKMDKVNFFLAAAYKLVPFAYTNRLWISQIVRFVQKFDISGFSRKSLMILGNKIPEDLEILEDQVVEVIRSNPAIGQIQSILRELTDNLVSNVAPQEDIRNV